MSTITSEAQILNVENVSSATSKLEVVVDNLEDAIEKLEEAKSLCSTYFEISSDNLFVNHIQTYIVSLESQITAIKGLYNYIERSAASIAAAERNSYKAWKAEQKRLAEESTQAQTLPSTGSYSAQTLPYKGSGTNAVAL